MNNVKMAILAILWVCEAMEFAHAKNVIVTTTWTQMLLAIVILTPENVSDVLITRMASIVKDVDKDSLAMRWQ